MTIQASLLSWRLKWKSELHLLLIKTNRPGHKHSIHPPLETQATLPCITTASRVDELTCSAKNLVFKFWEFCRMCTTCSHMSGLFCRSRSIWSAALLWNERQQIQLLLDNAKATKLESRNKYTKLTMQGNRWWETAVSSKGENPNCSRSHQHLSHSEGLDSVSVNGAD